MYAASHGRILPANSTAPPSNCAVAGARFFTTIVCSNDSGRKTYGRYPHALRRNAAARQWPGGAVGDPRRQASRADLRARAGIVQGNVAILPARSPTTSCVSASATRSPARCSAVSAPGDWRLPALGVGSTSAPTCRATACGATASSSPSPTDLRNFWRDDFVTFVIGCSFSLRGGAGPRGHRAAPHRAGRNVPMYRTTIATCRPGRSAGRWWCRCGR